MPITTKCSVCNGAGGREYLVSMHDDVTEWSTCHKCNGSGNIHTMTDQEEQDYHSDYW